ncbi:protein MTSS 1 isoform X2 [Thalassophryne amazonica]|uniref:protein MTSS 1 isoform X2 n=1 Tax=Thalassophryne amazonica TaxID=390379 RepID=UPI001471FB16|nr:protein MTSS 1 isoform X2 [Thalassophryne amazonica]
MDSGMEKECGALGGLFQLIMSDMKASYPTWEDFVSKGAKLQSQLRTTILVTGAFLDAFQKVADMATGTRGATKEIGTALTRMCMRHRSIESKLKLFTTTLSESLIAPLEMKMEEWKKVACQLDKDHTKEYKKARADIKKKSLDTIKLQKKVKKGKGEAREQLDSALQDVNMRYAVLEETEKRAVCRALIEERARYCTFVTMLKPVLDHEINMLGEVTHLQTILEDLTSLTAEPTKLPPASEQVILDLKSSDFSYTYQTPPASPSSTMSRKSSINSTYQSGSVRSVPSLDSITCAVDGINIQHCTSPYRPIGCDETGRSLSEGNSPSCRGHQASHGRYGYTTGPTHHLVLTRRVSRRDKTDAVGSSNHLASGGSSGAENDLLAVPHNAYTDHTSGKSCSARDQLALTLGTMNSDAPRSSRDSLHCSSGYSTQTTTPSCSEDTIHTHIDYESISLHGDIDSFSLHHLSHANNQSDFDKSSTIPRNSDLCLQYRKFAQSKRPASTVSLVAEPELIGGPTHQFLPHTATIRRKPLTKPAYRRGTISGGVPIPICTPQVPLKAFGGSGGSEENVFTPPSAGGAPLTGGFSHNKLCTSSQSLSALSQSSSTSPYYQLVPGQMPIPVPIPTVPSLPAEGSTNTQQMSQQQQLGQVQHTQQLQNRHHQLQQHGQVLHQQSHQQYNQQQQPHINQQLLQQQPHINQQLLQQQPHINQQLLQQQPHINQQLLTQQKQKVSQRQYQVQHPVQPEASTPVHDARYQPQPPPSTQDTSPEQTPQDRGAGDMLTLIRRVTLRRTVTNDRSAPMLPPPTNHK